MSRLIFVGSEESGYFASEVAKQMKAEFIRIDEAYHIKEQETDLNLQMREGAEAVIYDCTDYVDSVEVIIGTIKKHHLGNGIIPIILFPTTSRSNELISLALDSKITNFVNSSLNATDRKNELAKCLSGYYEHNKRADIEAIIEEKEREKEKASSYTSIGVAGSMHRIGTTTQCIQLARYIASRGHRACIIDYSGNEYERKGFGMERDKKASYIEMLSEAFDEDSYDDELSISVIDGISFLKDREKVSMLIHEESYDYHIYDYGVYTGRDFEKSSFLEKQKQVFVVGADICEIDKTVDILQNTGYKEAKLVFSFVPKNEEKFMQELAGSKAGDVIFAPYSPNPFILSDQNTYEKILEVSERKEGSKSSKKKGFSLFRGKRR